jgi:uncharacterized protein DUF4231
MRNWHTAPMADPSGDNPPDETSAYITDRLKQYQGWYDAKARQAKARYLAMRTGAVIAGAIVPVLVNVDFRYSKVLTSCLSNQDRPV